MWPITLRRTKDLLNDLPQKEEIDVFIELSDLEKEFYIALFAYCKERVKKLLIHMERLRKEKELKIKTKNEPTDPGKLLSLFIDI
jgi:SNF2 family DNA or RNA helicase